MTDLIERTLLGLNNQPGNLVSSPGGDGYVAATEVAAKPIGCMQRTIAHCKTSSSPSRVSDRRSAIGFINGKRDPK